MRIGIFSPLTIGHGFPTVVEDVLVGPDLHVQGYEEDRHFLNNDAWQHTRVTGAERKEATSLKSLM